MAPAVGAEPCLGGPGCWTLFPLGDGLALPVYTSHPLDRPAPQIERAVVVVHGIYRNAHQYFPQITAAAGLEGLRRKTLVVAPSFAIKSDDRPRRGVGEVYWRRNRNWRRGDHSASRPEGRISSFVAVERLLTQLGAQELFPNLRKITLVGHSAGGQFVQRFAVVQALLPALDDVRVRYVVANPGTYLYLNAQRPTVGDQGFALPYQAARCPRYNRYSYGLERPNWAMRRVGEDILLARAREREVILLLGAADNDPGHKTLNRTCAAALQGRHRLERGLLFKAHLDRFLAGHRTRVIQIPGVGHSSEDMFRSLEGRRAIFF
ncbi:alpha/beta fold hydrolase [Pelagibius sp.]|uniref:alpha/beta fold hydrolase n=1 Tax=Pelagibius sp. TaxID=1931238 RepID=UPI00261D7544|nr:alpha/beta fold hydrolase [Pelagibius sp.]